MAALCLSLFPSHAGSQVVLESPWSERPGGTEGPFLEDPHLVGLQGGAIGIDHHIVWELVQAAGLETCIASVVFGEDENIVVLVEGIGIDHHQSHSIARVLAAAYLDAIGEKAYGQGAGH